MEKYKEIKKNYNSDKTFVQISKELHKSIKEHCKNNDMKVKEFLEEIIKKALSQ
jgi:hemerythrin